MFNTWGTPTLLDIITYLVAVDRDGNLRWARRISGVTLATPVAASGSIYVCAQKLPSMTALEADNVVIRLAFDTGKLISQTSIERSRALNLKPAGFIKGQLFVHAVTRQNQPLIGAFNADLSSGTFKQFDPIPGSGAALSLNTLSETLLFSVTADGGFGIEAFTLNTSLEPLLPGVTPACPVFSEVTVPLVNPQVRLEAVVLTPPPLSLSAADTDLPLIPSARLALQEVQRVLSVSNDRNGFFSVQMMAP